MSQDENSRDDENDIREVEVKVHSALSLLIEMIKLKAEFDSATEIIHDFVVTMQAAVIEWKHGEGAEGAMEWITSKLEQGTAMPDETAPYAKEAQAWFDANRANPYPECFCGRPSNIRWMDQGFCSEAHYQLKKNESLN